MTDAGSDLERCAQELMETVPPVMRFIRTEMRRHGSPALSVPQFRTLAYIHRHPGASLSDVAAHLGVTPPTASTLVERLVQQGLVERADDPQERRRHRLSLTAAGAELLRAAHTATRHRVAAALSALTPEQLQAVAAGLALLRQAFREVVKEPDASSEQ